ncbi:MAG TPA: MFS transporter [Candidatus Baltobacteraceae bacterium]|nr:MFS transporter [Candidatus Baltobacteraceae bacterium]
MRELFEGRRGRVAAGLLVSEFVAATQGLVVAAIMPRVVADLHGLGEYALAFTAFFAAFFLFLPFAGPWADRYGLRRVLAVALALLGAGLALVAIAPNMPAFLGARFVEGVGDGLDYAMSFTAIAKSFPDHLRTRMMSLNATMWVVPGLIAPGLGAFVATQFGWRWAFAGLLPLIVIAAVLILPAVEQRPNAQRTDPFGALRLLFSRATLFAQGSMHASLFSFALLHTAFFGADAYVALALVGVRGLSLEAASFCITGAVLGWSATALLAPAMQERWGSARVVTLGAAATVVATAGFVAIALGAPIWIAYAAWLLAGAGMGFAYPTLSAGVFGGASEGREGVVSSAMALAAIVGLLAGTSICGIPIALAAQFRTPLRDAVALTFVLATLFGAALFGVAAKTISREAPGRTSP